MPRKIALIVLELIGVLAMQWALAIRFRDGFDILVLLHSLALLLPWWCMRFVVARSKPRE